MTNFKFTYQSTIDPQEKTILRTLTTEKSKNNVRSVYLFEFNGQSFSLTCFGKKDDYVFGSTGTSYTTMFWQYDSRLGRRWNLDPKPNPNVSYYATFADNPILYSDVLGDSILVEIIEREGQKPLLKITFTANLYNKSNQELTPEQLKAIANTISEQLKDSYSGEYENYDVEVNTHIKTFTSYNEMGYSDQADELHFIEIANSDDPEFTKTSTTKDVGASNREIGIMKINIDIIDKKSQLKRTSGHEWGHLAGLSHPDEAPNDNTNDALNDPDNLMWQSSKSMGTHVTKCQIEEIKTNFENK